MNYYFLYIILKYIILFEFREKQNEKIFRIYL
jgi:hypothetical protein